MAFTRSQSFRLFVLSIILIVPMAAFAADNVGTPAGGGASIEWAVKSRNYDHIELRVVDPDGESISSEFDAGVTPSFSVSELGGGLKDGQYSYEMRVVPNIPSGVQINLQKARKANDDAAIRKILRDNGLDKPVVQSGVITILNGQIVRPGQTEPTAHDSSASVKSVASDATLGERAARPINAPQALDQVIPDDLIVQGSTCTGFDCVNNESFGFDTFRLKENNLRIHFDDTSASAGFPANDWRIVANDSGSGGANFLAIEDSTAGRNIFVAKAGAPANGIFLDSTGRVGFRNSAPGLDLHMTTTDTPAIRFEQSNAGGFTAQTWDIGANEANFFVRDLTGGSRLSFRIRPGAPTSSVDIAATGKVGMGTASPSERLHVFENADANSIMMIENTNTGTSANGTVRAKSDTATVNFQAHGSGRTISRFGQTLGGWSEMLQVAGNGLIMGTLGSTPLILGTNSTARMTLAAAGGVTVTGNFTVTGTKNFAVVDPGDSKKALYYTALEGPEAGTYYRGTATTVNGEVVIELPGYFTRLTESERMTVQLTPVGSWGQVYVAEKTPEKLVIKVAEGTKDLKFDYFVQGVRKGYLDYEVERAGAFPVQQ